LQRNRLLLQPYVPYFKFRLNMGRICGKSEGLAASRLIVRRDTAFCWNVFRRRRTNFLGERPLGKPMFHRVPVPSSSDQTYARGIAIRIRFYVICHLFPVIFIYNRQTLISYIWSNSQSVSYFRIWKIYYNFDKL